MPFKYIYHQLPLLLLALLTPALALVPLPPIWRTSPYLRAGSYDLITTPTTFNVTPMVTMPFSSSFVRVPNVAYGMFGYKGRHKIS